MPWLRHEAIDCCFFCIIFDVVASKIHMNPTLESDDASLDAPSSLPRIIVFNACDPTGAGGLGADVVTIAAASAYALPVATSVYIRDTLSIRAHHNIDADVIEEQARCVLEDIEVSAFKLGFLGGVDAISSVSEIISDYPDTPVVVHVSDMPWLDDVSIDQYLDAVSQMVLPQSNVLVGQYQTLCRWLLPDWEHDKPPTARDIAKAAFEHGVPYTWVTGMTSVDQRIDNQLASPETVLCSAQYERKPIQLIGLGDTLSAAFAALLSVGSDLATAATESLAYVDQCVHNPLDLGMGHLVPDRMFWAHEDDDSDGSDDQALSVFGSTSTVHTKH
jgi:hydroxymethylpyrimidine/phosphomethylpyrimidine kinase